jgi:hypothetical protein
MTAYTPSAFSLVDEKTALSTHCDVPSASPLNSRLGNFRKNVADRGRRARERLAGLAIDDDVMKELNAWEDKGDIHSQLVRRSPILPALAADREQD